MALQSSGAISLANIAAEFGGSTPHSLSEYYGVASGVPSSGTISLSNFYGTSAITYSAATGGSVTTSGVYKYHIFYSSGTFSISQVGTDGSGFDHLVIGGGGGAGSGCGGANGTGGGGAGGMRASIYPSGQYTTDSKRTFSVGNYSVVVGGGGSGATGTSCSTVSRGNNGGNSYISGSGVYIEGTGGGAGGDYYSYLGGTHSPTSGGSGGGGAGGRRAASRQDGPVRADGGEGSERRRSVAEEGGEGGAEGGVLVQCERPEVVHQPQGEHGGREGGRVCE